MKTPKYQVMVVDKKGNQRLCKATRKQLEKAGVDDAFLSTLLPTQK